MNRFIKRILRLIFVKKIESQTKEMSLVEKYMFARNSYQHFAIRSIYGRSDTMGRTATQSEIDRCHELANKYQCLMDEYRTNIIEQETQKIHEEFSNKLMDRPSQ